MKEREKFEEGMEQGRQERRAEGLNGETGMSEAFEKLIYQIKDGGIQPF